MGRVFLVRHGQASFGAADYDQLSDLGRVQCQRLGEHWLAGGQSFAGVLHGSLKRHRQSFQAIQQALPIAADARVRPGLNEYDSDALIQGLNQAQHLVSLPHVSDATAAREHFRRLREALQLWMQGQLMPQGMPSFADFRQGVALALKEAHAASRDGDVLVVSSGGPISVAVGEVLHAPIETIISLNLRLRNSAVCELASTGRGFDLVGFNDVSHLDSGSRSHA